MITINWGNDSKSIMQYEFEGRWSVEDMVDALDSGVEVANRYDHDIDVIVDLTRSGLPNLFGMNVNKAFKQAFARSEEHMEKSSHEPGMVVVVTSNPIIRNSLKSILSLHPTFGGNTLTVADTLDDAHEQIAAFRQRQVVA
jgi:hypothetical protein